MTETSPQRRHAVVMLCAVLSATTCAIAWIHDGFSTTSRVLTTAALVLAVALIWRLDTKRRSP